MNKSNIINKLISFFVALLMMFSIAIVKPMPISADVSDIVKVNFLKSYTKDEKYYMSFDIENIYYTGDSIEVWAKLFDNAGNEIFNWNKKEIEKGETLQRNFNANYNHLPNGKYKFKLYVSLKNGIQSWNWAYTINHKRKESFSFTDFEKVKSNDMLVYKWSIKCINLKDAFLIMKIYDSDNNLVYKVNGVGRKTNNEVGWFTWSGNKIKNGKVTGKYPSGTYLVQITASNSDKVIEQEYKLNIN